MSCGIGPSLAWKEGAISAMGTRAVIAQEANSWVCDPGLAPLARCRSHSVPRTGFGPVFPAGKAGVLTRLHYRGPNDRPANHLREAGFSFGQPVLSQSCDCNGREKSHPNSKVAIDMWTFRCYIDDQDSDSIRVWYDAQLDEVQAELDAIIEILRVRPRRWWRMPQ